MNTGCKATFVVITGWSQLPWMILNYYNGSKF